ncbi:MAG: polyamine ABC transporter substrate-binding protein [Parvibaculaceae bacterium]
MQRMNRRTVLKAGAASLAMPYIITSARAQGGTVNVFNWTDYIGETTLDDFKAATGIEATYDTYDSTESMEAKMLAGSTGYDVVLQAGSTLQRFIEAGTYQKLDKSKLPNWKNLDPELLKIVQGWDENNDYGAIYMWGTVGLTYNLDMVKQRLPNADLASLDILFKPENISKLADCGISILDSPGDVVPLVLAYLGKPRPTTDPKDYEAVVEAFKPIRQHIRTFDNSNYLNAIPNKELCVINNWSGDYATAKSRAEEAGIEIDLAYYVPKTGSPAWFDLWCIPKDAPHVDAAHTFINYLMEPEVIGKCTNFTNYAHANVPGKEFTDKAVLENPAVFPDAEIRARLWTEKTLSQELERARTDAWSRIKTGS